MPALTWKRILASLLPAFFPETAVNAVPVLQREWTRKETALGEIPQDKQLRLWSVTRMANSLQNSRDDPSEERSIPPLLSQLSTKGCQNLTRKGARVTCFLLWSLEWGGGTGYFLEETFVAKSEFSIVQQQPVSSQLRTHWGKWKETEENVGTLRRGIREKIFLKPNVLDWSVDLLGDWR